MPQLHYMDGFDSDFVTTNRSQERSYTQNHQALPWHSCSHLDDFATLQSAKLRVLANVPSALHSIVLPHRLESSISVATVDHVWKRAVDGTMHIAHTLKDVLSVLGVCLRSDCRHTSSGLIDIDASFYSNQNTHYWGLNACFDATLKNPDRSRIHVVSDYPTISLHEPPYQPLDKSTVFLAVACYTQILQILNHLGGILKDAVISGNKPSIQLLDIQTTSVQSLLSPSVQTVLMAHLIKQSVAELSTYTSHLLQITRRPSLATNDIVSTGHHDSSTQCMGDEIRQLEFDLFETLSAIINMAESVVA